MERHRPQARREAGAPPESWLHRLHGDDPNGMQPMRVPRTEKAQSHAAAMSAVVSSSQRGVRCTVDGGSLFVEGCAAPLCSLFLARASHAPLAADSVAVVIVPADGAGLQGLALGQDAAGAPCWLVVVAGACLQALLDALSRAGCLRDDLEVAFEHAPGDIFGQGAYATVVRMVATDGQLVAVKNLNPSVEFECIEREIDTLIATQRHPNVVGYRGTFWSPDPEGPQISMVFDAACGGDLLAKVLHSDPLTEAYAKALFHGMMKGIAHIHSHEIVHRDIKAQNILLMSDDTVVVADFGLATVLTDKVQMARRCGSPGYVAPEVCLGKEPYGLKVDVFGAGVNLYLMLSKDPVQLGFQRDLVSPARLS
ncbi:unnamed protein product [Prorocentrum cordatum]|uniref:Protein kinase domain-containing protein n=1 Tax=Prorocentrum cordatum TaxID=2364126 RepID=A0ABN9SQT6_9DINO|nr:unnamed protein product [Polarella glacialis]